MTAIRHTLQRDVFLPNDERLIGFVHVTKTGKKKKVSFLCATVTTDVPAQVSVHKVKKVDKDTYKKRQSWNLAELREVDGKDSCIDIPDFDLHFDKCYKWIASNPAEKNSFIETLWKLTQRYLKQLKKPDFVNINESLLEEFTPVGDQSRVQHAEDDLGTGDDYQVLAAREEADLERMMAECEFAIGNAEAFVERLANDLSVLDGANIHSIIESQQEVARLMHVLDESLLEVNKLENNLDEYDRMLEGVRVHMEIMEQKDSMIQIQSQNHSKLIDQLRNIIGQLDMPHHYKMAIIDSDLGTPKGILDCTDATQCLQEKMEAEIHPGLNKLRAIIDQKDLLTNLQEKFAQRLAIHLNNIFVQQGSMTGDNLAYQSGRLALPKHHNFHRDLIPYPELMQWLKKADYTSFKLLSRNYTKSLHKLYSHEISEFFEHAKQALISKTKSTLDPKKFGFGGRGQLQGSTGDLSKSGSKSKGQEFHGSEAELTDRQRFDMVFTQVLNEVAPMCQAEQDFCAKFFGLGSDTDYVQSASSSRHAEHGSNPGGKDFVMEELMGTIDSTPGKQKKEDKKATILPNNEMREVMADLFQTLEPELKNFIAFAERVDNFFSVYMLVRIGYQVMASPNKQSSSYLRMVLANCLIEVKRNFDKYIDGIVTSIRETKMSRKSKCGILPFVKEFEWFAEQAETVFKGSDRRGDLDKAYSKLIQAQFSAIHKIALDHQKTPSDVVIFENFHHLHGTLSRLKITCLEAERKEAKQKYNDHLQAYIRVSLGRPMDKLNQFFEGIQVLVSQGVKEEEVGYQMAFNKQELRKVIREYPGKEVRRGLDNLYRKMEKTLCEEENLMQVSWHLMQEEFIRQYKHFEDLINRCYPGANVTLEFKVEDVLQFFSEIAQSH
ncbi:exocyst complex component 1-like isoform X1 [Patiria miniata]|uniref:Exocyst complex component Sec3 PIP2-binding N-terminal domain-containing protein n=1 Tax=Patiria miniata TaxID=46514 RepID=A0A913ZYG2_PATMI|nr:exocyst complex component 1-like isoform X1 [Patiria miniata]